MSVSPRKPFPGALVSLSGRITGSVLNACKCVRVGQEGHCKASRSTNVSNPTARPLCIGGKGRYRLSLSHERTFCGNGDPLYMSLFVGNSESGERKCSHLAADLIGWQWYSGLRISCTIEPILETNWLT